MKKLFLVTLLAFLAIVSEAQTARELQATANTFLRQGDYANAVLVLTRALDMEPNNMSVTKDLALVYNLQKQNDKALPLIKKVIDSDQADDQSFQIAGSIYIANNDVKEAEKLYKRALKKFPQSGPLYCEYGEVLMGKKDESAIDQWEKGIQVDPNYSKNYFNASKFYFIKADPTWTILYGEIFVNMEPFGQRTAEIKNIILDGYKKLFTSSNFDQKSQNKNEFEKAFLSTMDKQKAVVNFGISTEILTMVRTRFILDWYASNYQDKFPFKLFDLHKDLLQNGLFEIYDQWMVGSVENLKAYQNYITLHKQQHGDFIALQKGRNYKQPMNQYYK